tara:strand:+ start:223 stop:534 length:312 start_codon:yes stop_codon:yes gene_type:complete
MRSFTTKWTIQDYLNTPEAIAGYLEAVFEGGDPKLITTALEDVARSKGISQIASDAGVSREALCGVLGKLANFKHAPFFGVLKAMKLTLKVWVEEGPGPFKAE